MPAPDASCVVRAGTATLRRCAPPQYGWPSGRDRSPDGYGPNSRIAGAAARCRGDAGATARRSTVPRARRSLPRAAAAVAGDARSPPSTRSPTRAAPAGGTPPAAPDGRRANRRTSPVPGAVAAAGQSQSTAPANFASEARSSSEHSPGREGHKRSAPETGALAPSADRTRLRSLCLRQPWPRPPWPGRCRSGSGAASSPRESRAPDRRAGVRSRRLRP